MTRPKVIVGLSGGVDSAVAALLLQQQGYPVETLFMKNWDEDDSAEYCSAAVDLEDAAAVADRLGVRLHRVNFSTEYWDRVFAYFLREYRAGRTPNPDILCNKEIKFRAFLDYAVELGGRFIATGHYARVSTEHGTARLRKGGDKDKDQSYFLFRVSQPALQRTLFPLGELKKTAVRRLAHEAGFANHAKKDSTGICFIGERRFKNFLARYLPARPGAIVSLDGERLGTHQGLMYHTIGQRQGLGIGGTRSGTDDPWYVAAKDLEHNRLLVVQGANHPALFSDWLEADDVHWIGAEPDRYPFPARAKIRYRQSDQDCEVERLAEGRLRVTFAQPQRAVTPGQAVVFYQGDLCLGGATIC
jgi:tRNA-specific 2-thiouridylase